MIGKYEFRENIQSIDVTANIADALTVNFDYLVKVSQYEEIENNMLKRL